MGPDTPELNDVYSLKTAEQARKLYDNWSATYDDGFAQAHDFLIPAHVRDIFASEGGSGPILDVGAGTGLVGVELSGIGAGPIDGVDISPEMLAIARSKRVYRALYEGDVRTSLNLSERYMSLVSSGTFTHGHVGPAALAPLAQLAAPGALCVLSINAKHFDASGFQPALNALAPQNLVFIDLPIYGPNGPEGHAGDLTRMTTFRLP